MVESLKEEKRNKTEERKEGKETRKLPYNSNIFLNITGSFKSQG